MVKASVSLEDALDQVGTGPFQWRMLAICGLANAADAVEVMCVGLVATAATEMDLSSQRIGYLNASTLAGMFVGALSWGMLSDAMGRRPTLMLALLMNCTCGVLSAGAGSFWVLCLLRTLAGVGVGGSMPVVFSQMSEFCEAKSRGRLMALCAACWMFGSMYSAAMGWLVIPSWGWRAFVVITALPAGVALAAAFFFMPESPRYLVASGRTYAAGQVMRQVATANGVTLSADFRLSAIDGAGCDTPPADDEDEELARATSLSATPLGGLPQGAARARKAAAGRPWLSPASALRLLSSAAVNARSTLTTLLVGPLRRYTWPLMLGWIGLCGGWYCMVLWLPTYFQRRGATGSSLYAETFAVALANLPGNAVAIYAVDRLGRRLTACVCMALACVCALMFAAAPAHGYWPLAAACVFNGVSVGGWASLDLISTELYPTQVRSSGFGLLNSIGRISSFLTTVAAGRLLDYSLWAPLVLSALLLAMGSAAMLTLPEPAGRPLEDALPQEDDGGLLGGGCDATLRVGREGGEHEKVGLLSQQQRE